jgi:hypothetical protein
VLLGALPAGSAAAKNVAAYRASQRELAKREERAQKGKSSSRSTSRSPGAEAKPGGGAATDKGLERDAFARELEERKRAHASLVAGFEREHRSLVQMLELRPVDLLALSKRLRDDEVVLQYLPTPQKLFIHVVTKTGARMQEVDVGSVTLFEAARRAAAAVCGRSPEVSTSSSLAEHVEALATDAVADLHWLYEKLLAPVESDLFKTKHVFVVPVGPLSYVPFAALIRTAGSDPEYAVFRYTLGVVTTLYMLDLVMDRTNLIEWPLIFANPDNSLPASEREAGEVATLLHSSTPPFVLAQATLDALKKGAGGRGSPAPCDSRSPQRNQTGAQLPRARQIKR